MSFANKGAPMADPQCVRCSACVQECPTGVLSLRALRRSRTARKSCSTGCPPRRCSCGRHAAREITPPMTDVWIDTDPSIGVPLHEADDGFALVQAFHSPEVRISVASARPTATPDYATTTRIAREMADPLRRPRQGHRAGHRSTPERVPHAISANPPPPPMPSAPRVAETPSDLPRPRSADQPRHPVDAPSLRRPGASSG